MAGQWSSGQSLIVRMSLLQRKFHPIYGHVYSSLSKNAVLTVDKCFCWIFIFLCTCMLDIFCAQADNERAAFMRLAGDDGEIDAFELQDILNQEFKKREIFIC